METVMRSLFRFPDPVNEVSARLVAGGVVLLALAALVTGSPWWFGLLAYGFVARVLTGPTLSPLGQFVTRVVTPRLPVAPRWVPGPPKRFAQGIGATLSVGAAVLLIALDASLAARVLVGMVVVAATLESVFAYCLGCTLFGWLIRRGVIPERICERCVDLRADERASTTV
jgi:hypothetical protein